MNVRILFFVLIAFSFMLLFSIVSVQNASAQQHPNLIVSPENLFGGSMIVEVIIVDPDLRDTNQAEPEPDVTVNGKKLRMVQGADGWWYAFFADKTSALNADATELVNSLTGTQFGVGCTSTSASDIAGIDFSDTRGIFFPRALNTLGGGTSSGVLDNCTGDSTSSSNTLLMNVLRGPPTPSSPPSGLGQLGINDGSWGFVQLFDFVLDGNVHVEYLKGGGSRNVILTFVEEDEIINLIDISKPFDIIYVSNGNDVSRFSKLSGNNLDSDGTFLTSADRLNFPNYMTIGPDKNLYISDTFDQAIKVFTQDGVPVGDGIFWLNPNLDIFGNFEPWTSTGYPQDLTFGPDGNLYVVTNGTTVTVIAGPLSTNSGQLVGDGTFVTYSDCPARCDLTGIVFGPDGNLYATLAVGDTSDPYPGRILVFQGSPGTSPTSAIFFQHPDIQPFNLAFDPDGNLFFTSETGGQIWKLKILNNQVIGNSIVLPYYHSDQPVSLVSHEIIFDPACTSIESTDCSIFASSNLGYVYKVKYGTPNFFSERFISKSGAMGLALNEFPGDGGGKLTSTITIIKKIINDNGGTASVRDFRFILSSNYAQWILVSGQTQDVAPGEYSVSESGPSGYSIEFRGDCDSEGIIRISEGEHLVCVVINDDKIVSLRDPSGTDSPSLRTITIPSWIKLNAGWWSGGQINDDSFVEGIKYLIKEDIMRIPETKAGTETSQEIPSWIKQNADWWANDQITDESFVNGIQWLIKNGIMRIG